MNTKKKLRGMIILHLLLAMASLAWPAQAQGEELTLRLSRDFGYSSGTGRIQGTFSMKVSGPADLAKVSFMIDDQLIGEDSQPPFEIQFHTGDFPIGVHTLHATGITSQGRQLRSSQQQREFVPAEEAGQMVVKIVLPILGIVAAIMLLSYVLPILLDRGKKGQLPLGTPRSYGLLGGTICPKCGRPFAMHVYGMNLMVGKFDRCPHCGRWSLVRRASLSMLREAEAAESEQAEAISPPALSEEERLRKELDDSRYQDL